MMRIKRAAVTPEPEARGFDSFELRLGDVMRGERATMGKSLLDVQRDIRIKAAFIAAIENCDVSAFPTRGFVAGFVRSYARYLGLDPDWTYQRFCDESGFSGVHGADDKPRTAPRNEPVRYYDDSRRADPLGNPRAPFAPGRPAWFADLSAASLGSTAVLVFVIGLLGYGVVSVVREIQRVEITDAAAVPVLTEIDPVATAATAATENAAAPQPRRFDPADPAVSPRVVARDGPIAAIDPATVGTLAPQPASPAAVDTVAVAAQAPEAEAEIVIPVVTGAQVAIYASRPAWVRVSAADGTVVLEKVLDADEVAELPDGAEGLSLRAGNSGAVFLKVGDLAYGPVGEGTRVIKNVALGATEIIDRFGRIADAETIRPLRRPRPVAEASATQ